MGIRREIDNSTSNPLKKITAEKPKIFKQDGFITLIRLIWVDLFQRMKSNEMAKKIKENIPVGRVNVRRPRSRWMEG